MKSVAVRTTAHDPADRDFRSARPAEEAPAPITPVATSMLQRKAGCACGGGCPRCQANTVSSKYTVNAPGDRYEQEADRVADQVMRMPDPQAAPALASTASPQETVSRTIQRACASCRTGGMQEQEVEMQAKEEQGSTPEVSGEIQGRIDSLRGGGDPLPSSVRSYFEPRFGADFSGVRVHTGAAAAETARAVRAQAYTIGGDIVFGTGRYAPESDAGRRLLAHELVHTIQQGASTSAGTAAQSGTDGAPIARPMPTMSLQRTPDHLIQRADDASYEADGLGAAITGKTMTPDNAVHGKTFSATNCFGREKCKVDFKFDKGYKGDYSYASAGGKMVRGVYVKIVITYSADTCGSCNQVKLLQVVRGVTQTGGNMVATDPDNQVRRDRSGWGDPKAPSRGWRVDALISSKDPYYTATTYDAQVGTATTPALLYDAPGDWTTDRNMGKEFETCAICAPASGSATVLGCVNWGYYIDGSGVVAFKPATPSATCGTMQQVTDATKRWDAMPGNTAANIDFAHNPPAPPAPAGK